MPDALTKSITVSGWVALVKVRLATPRDSHPEGLSGPSSLGPAWEEPLREMPVAADLPLPQKSGLKRSGCLRTWTVSWLCPSTYFLTTCTSVANATSPPCCADARAVWELGWSRHLRAGAVGRTAGGWRLPAPSAVTSAALPLAQVMLTPPSVTPRRSAAPKPVPELSREPPSRRLLFPPRQPLQLPDDASSCGSWRRSSRGQFGEEKPAPPREQRWPCESCRRRAAPTASPVQLPAPAAGRIALLRRRCRTSARRLHRLRRGGWMRPWQGQSRPGRVGPRRSSAPPGASSPASIWGPRGGLLRPRPPAKARLVRRPVAECCSRLPGLGFICL